MRRGSPVVVSMSMINADRDSAPSARVADARSPFVRLAELLADINPGKPAINLSVGEPQHPIPSFVGPTLAAHLAEFGRYPAGKGTESFRRAAAGWLGRRYRLKRPVDPENEIIVLSGTREGLFLAAIAAKRWVGPRAGTPAILLPNPFYAVYSAAALAAECEPVYLAATAAHAFLPDLDLLDDALLSRARAFYLASPANPQGAVANQAYLSRLAGLARRHGFLVFTDECYSEIYSEHAPPGMLEAACPDFAMRWCSTRSPSARACRDCGSASRPATGASSASSSTCATSRPPRCRSPPRPSRSLPMRTRRTSRRTGGSTRRSSTSPTRSSAIATVTGARPAGSSCGLTSARSAAASKPRCGCGARRACGFCPAASSRAIRPTAAIRAPTTSASPWCRTRRRRPKRCTASSRCLAEDDHAGRTPDPSGRRVPARRYSRGDRAAPARDRRRRPDRARGPAGDRAGKLVRPGPEPEPRHVGAGAQPARCSGRHRRGPADAAVRPRRPGADPAHRGVGVAARHPSAARPRAAAPDGMDGGLPRGGRVRLLPAGERRVAAADRARRRHRRPPAAPARLSVRRAAGRNDPHRGGAVVRARRARRAGARRGLRMAPLRRKTRDRGRAGRGRGGRGRAPVDFARLDASCVAQPAGADRPPVRPPQRRGPGAAGSGIWAPGGRGVRRRDRGGRGGGSRGGRCAAGAQAPACGAADTARTRRFRASGDRASHRRQDERSPDAQRRGDPGQRHGTRGRARRFRRAR